MAREVFKLFEQGQIDVVQIWSINHFKSAISQVVTFQQIIPLVVSGQGSVSSNPDHRPLTADHTPYEYEPDEEEILANLLPRNISVQVYKALL